MSDVRRAKRCCLLYVTPNSFERLENSVAKLLVFVFACFGWLACWVLMEINGDGNGNQMRMANNSPNECIKHRSSFKE